MRDATPPPGATTGRPAAVADGGATPAAAPSGAAAPVLLAATGPGDATLRAIGADLLAWYDVHAREMPWRVGPAARRAGQRPDPYAVWLSEVMLQQTTVAAVRAYHLRFTARWPRVEDLAAADDADVMGEWAGLGYYARARNLLACARVVAQDPHGRFPPDRDALMRLPGIGPYTAAAVAAIAFDRPETVVDGNVERVMARLFAVEAPLPRSKLALTGHAASLTPRDRPGDHAQAVMDLGATVCTPRNPACGICPLTAHCAARAAGVAADLPRRLPKAARPVRKGTVYVARRTDGAWLLERRAPTGLLGGMLGWPGTDWVASDASAPEAGTPDAAGVGDSAGARHVGEPPVPADWRSAGEVRHTFTHFHLILSVMAATVPGSPVATRGAFAALDPGTLPTLMRKVHSAAVAVLDGQVP